MSSKAIIIFFIATILLLGFTTIEPVMVDVEGLKLNGRVRVYKVTEILAWDSLGERPYQESYTDEYYFNTEGNQIQTSSWIGDEYQGKVVNNYNMNNNLLSVQNFDAKNKLMFTELIANYDNNGNIIEQSFYEKDGSLYEKSIFVYDVNQNLIEKKVSLKIYISHGDAGKSCSGKIRYSGDTLYFHYYYKYDEQDRLIEEKITNECDELVELSKWKFEDNYFEKVKEVYDSTGNLTSKEAEEFYENGGIKKFINYYLDSLGTREEWNYNMNEKVNNIKLITPNKEYFILEVEFDFNGNPIKTYYYRNDTLDRIQTVKYKYDSRKNWIEKVANTGSGSYSIYRANIEYFD